MDSLEQVHSLMIAEVKRRLFKESIPRAKKCLDLLSDEDIWYRPNENSNSVGNLILHLCGNVRQWLISAIGEEADTRQRQLEFDERGPIPTVELISKLDQLQTDAEKVLDQTKPEILIKPYSVQGYSETGLSILIHIVEHFSGHIGQITYFVKARKDISTGYYDGQNLEVKNE
ncbi:MAG: DinB family protein [Bacteroidia bacterium]|nr:DinB family protein [Bacteroidia bacterium]